MAPIRQIRPRLNEQVYDGEMALRGCPAVISRVRQGARLNVPSGSDRRAGPNGSQRGALAGLAG